MSIYDKYKGQFEDYLKTIKMDKTAPPNIDFFVNLAIDYWNGDFDKEKVNIAMTDTYFPEIFIHALGARPIWVFGGNFFSGEQVDAWFPQISDPVIHSTIGILNINELGLQKKCSMIVVPIVNDSIKKSLPLLNNYKEVYPINICNLMFNSPTRQWENEMMTVIEGIEYITKRKLTIEKLNVTAKVITKAHKAIKRLLEIRNINTRLISEQMVLFLKQSYYMTDNIMIWTSEINKIYDSLCLKYSIKLKSVNPKIALLGSKIYAPNSKIPTMLDELKFDVVFNKTGVPLPNDYSGIAKIEKLGELIKNFHNLHYFKTFSAYEINSSVKNIIPQNTRGIIYHLIKGQVTYAFEAARIHDYAIKNGIPFIAVETDYTSGDAEQIKIRLEAFKEMLSHKASI